MDKRIEITKYVLESMGLNADDKRVRQTLPVWWQNPRRKEKGGMRLTQQGYECLKNAGLKDYQIDYPEKNPFITNKLVIQLDQFIDCPFYLTNKSIFVFGEKMAVQMVLFSGDIQKYASSKSKSKVVNLQH